MSRHLEAERAAILAAMLPAVPFDGWNSKTMRQAAVDAGFGAGMARRAFPGGVREAVDYFVADADRRMLAALDGLDLPAMKIRERVAAVVRARLELLAPHREAVRRALSVQLVPGASWRALTGLYRTVDAMWRACGDTATDFNHYSKRALLAGVYVSTLVYWLNDRSEGCADTWAFLGRRIDDVMTIQKVRGRWEKRAARLPSPVHLLASLRYGARRGAT